MKVWNLNILKSHLVALITLDIPGGYTTGHYNNTTHTDTCLFPKTNMTMSFYHLSLQRCYLVQVIFRFYKREFDYIDSYKMNVVNTKAQGLEVGRAMFPSWFCRCAAVWTWRSCLTSLGLSSFIYKECSRVDPQMEAQCGQLKANRRCGTETNGTTAWTLM